MAISPGVAVMCICTSGWTIGPSSMSLFEQLVNEARRNQNGLAPLQAVVEKELTHGVTISCAR